MEQIAAAINNSVPAPRAAALLDEIRDALDLDSGPAWEDLATEKALLQQEMEIVASVDQLTGLRNRQRFFEDLRREFSAARRYDTPLRSSCSMSTALRGSTTIRGSTPAIGYC